MPQATQPHVALRPELAAAARKRRLQQPHNVWCMLQALDDDGRGWLNLKSASVELQRHFGVARSTVRGWLSSDPDQIFWQHARHADGSRVIHLRGLASVHASLGYPRLSRRTSVPADEYRGVRGRNRAVVKGYIASRQRQPTASDVIKAFVANQTRPAAKHTRPMSRRSMQEHTTYSATSQRRYQRMGGITAHKNVLLRREGPTPEEALLKGMWSVHGLWFEPMPNSYSTVGVLVGGKKTIQKLNKLAHVSGSLSATARRYYHRIRAFMRHRGEGERFLMLKRQAGVTYWRPPERAT